jgi:hypothetical protein
MVRSSDARKGLVCGVFATLFLAGLLALGCGGSGGGESSGEEAGLDGAPSDGTSGADVATPDSAGSIEPPCSFPSFGPRPSGKTFGLFARVLPVDLTEALRVAVPDGMMRRAERIA